MLFLLDTVGEKQLANQWLFKQEGEYIYVLWATQSTPQLHDDRYKLQKNRNSECKSYGVGDVEW